MYRILETEEFKNWFNALNFKEKAQVQVRMAKLKIDGHFGIVKKQDKTLAEFKWKNGRRETVVRLSYYWEEIKIYKKEI